MENKNKRILWLVDDIALTESEVPFLISLGYEVYVAKKFSDFYRYDNHLTLPLTTLDYLNSCNFYIEEIADEMAEICNKYFQVTLFSFAKDIMQSLVRKFKGKLLLRVTDWNNCFKSYTEAMTKTFDNCFWHALKATEERFWFVPNSSALTKQESGILQRRAVTIPKELCAAWHENFVSTIMARSMPATQKDITIGVFLPLTYQGGSLRGAKNIAKMLKLGSKSQGDNVNVVFSCVLDGYNINDEFKDLLELGISIRETQWREVTCREVEIANTFLGIAPRLENNNYLLPTDGICNFNDCDFWLVVTDRTQPAIAPLKPYGIMAYDYIQRYIPGLFGDGFEEGMLTTVRNARAVFVTTPQTADDAVQYAGVNRNRVVLCPMEFTAFEKISSAETMDNDYFIWTTNLALHKNHVRAFEALDRYYLEHNGQLNVVITGYNTSLLMDKNQLETANLPYLLEAYRIIQRSPILKDKVKVLGHLNDTNYANAIINAKFLWHPALIDNGTYSVIEAAYYNVPSLSSDYPQMRYIDDCFRINLSLFDPLCSRKMAVALAQMEVNYIAQRALLPPKSYLDQFKYESLAPKFWQIVKKTL